MVVEAAGAVLNVNADPKHATGVVVLAATAQVVPVLGLVPDPAVPGLAALALAGQLVPALGVA